MPVEFWASVATVSVIVTIFCALMWRCREAADPRREWSH